MPTLAELANLIPPDLLSRSGSAFYSGRAAFSGTKPIYLLGLNPGGPEAESTPGPDGEAAYSLREHVAEAIGRSEDRWSAFVDEGWKTRAPGEEPMQKRVRSLLSKLSLDPADVPSSSVVLVRTRNEALLGQEFATLADTCWSFHHAVIEQLGVRVILCMGTTAGSFVCAKLGANTQAHLPLQERNGRGWSSTAYEAPNGRIVITLPHPSRSDWSTAECDPSSLVKWALEAVSSF